MNLIYCPIEDIVDIYIKIFQIYNDFSKKMLKKILFKRDDWKKQYWISIKNNIDLLSNHHTENKRFFSLLKIKDI